MKSRTPSSRLAALAAAIVFAFAAGSTRAGTILAQTAPDGGFAKVSSEPTGLVDLGALYVEGPMTIEAESTVFHFITFEMASGSSLNFVNLQAADTLRLIASESIRIRGELIFAPAGGLYIEAPLIEIGEGAVIEAPGGSITLVANRGIDNGPPSRDPLAGGGLTLRSGASIDVSGSGQPVRLGEVQLREGGSLSIARGGIVTVAAPVPEPETWAMLLAGLGLVGFAVRCERQTT